MRVAKATQRALDELDWPCAAGEIHGRFMLKARTALGGLPEPCFDSVERVATALAANHRNAEIPTGYGAACVRHFSKRNEQLGSRFRVSEEIRFALIEISSLASIAGQWAGTLQPRVTQASYKECLRHVAQLAVAKDTAAAQWHAVIRFVLEDPSSAPGYFQTIACALVWCGYFAPAQPGDSRSSVATDVRLAEHFFQLDRAVFVRKRSDALHLLRILRQMYVQSTAGGAP
jgi:hypothetical protein